MNPLAIEVTPARTNFTRMTDNRKKETPERLKFELVWHSIGAICGTILAAALASEYHGFIR
jgi:hypothetical protein